MTKKTCTLCKEELLLSEFNVARARKDGHQPHCRACGKAHAKGYYAANKTRMCAQLRVSSAKRRLRLQRAIYDYLLAHPCVTCGETDPVVLEFDHLDPTIKEANISTLVVHEAAWARILKEIRKCQVLCAKCHRRKTARDQKWFAYRFQQEDLAARRLKAVS